MTCRHRPGDPDCSSSPEGQARTARESAERLRRERDSTTPDKMKFDILDVVQMGAHLVVKVRYPSCTKCAYEGVKVIVYLDTALKEAIFWKEVDPHFRDPKQKSLRKVAPAPAARFPATEEGWKDALAYAQTK